MLNQPSSHGNQIMTFILDELSQLIVEDQEHHADFEFKLEELEQFDLEPVIRALQQIFEIADQIFIIAVIYLRRSGMGFSRSSIVPFFLVSLTCAVKFNVDYSKLSLQKIGAIAGKYPDFMEELEKTFLDSVGFDLFVGREDLDLVLNWTI